MSSSRYREATSGTAADEHPLRSHSFDKEIDPENMIQTVIEEQLLGSSNRYNLAANEDSVDYHVGDPVWHYNPLKDLWRSTRVIAVHSDSSVQVPYCRIPKEYVLSRLRLRTESRARPAFEWLNSVHYS